ncbi:hypothetical protein QJS04_geneDACA006922 [Acorus gramineus]|uniref:Peptidase S54 rhomboid domain-containing protein n=1 Tax=Acorus gramineus TaxID=55184 RepID=A0AAV9AU59_ACOGR|nr:hypothetical protein QJS04_geneDACA006922 [Acorus gramineus]
MQRWLFAKTQITKTFASLAEGSFESSIPSNSFRSSLYHPWRSQSRSFNSFGGSLKGPLTSEQVKTHSGISSELLRNYLFRSWRSQNQSFRSFCGSLTASEASKEVLRRTHLKIWKERLIDVFQSLQRRRLGSVHRVSNNYWRRFWNFLTPDEVLLSLIGVNVCVFLLWRRADPEFMKKNFLISLDNFTSGRIHTMITSAFSHVEFRHLFSNMIGLYLFGDRIQEIFGPKFLLKLYMAGALGGSIFYLVHKGYLLSFSKDWQSQAQARIPALGASASVNAIILLDIFLHPRSIIYANFFIPVPSMLMGAFIIGHDLWRVMQGERGISGSAHLGGAAVAGLAWLRIRKGRF